MSNENVGLKSCWTADQNSFLNSNKWIRFAVLTASYQGNCAFSYIFAIPFGYNRTTIVKIYLTKKLIDGTYKFNLAQISAEVVFKEEQVIENYLLGFRLSNDGSTIEFYFKASYLLSSFASVSLLNQSSDLLRGGIIFNLDCTRSDLSDSSMDKTINLKDIYNFKTSHVHLYTSLAPEGKQYNMIIKGRQYAFIFIFGGVSRRSIMSIFMQGSASISPNIKDYDEKFYDTIEYNPTAVDGIYTCKLYNIVSYAQISLISYPISKVSAYIEQVDISET